MTDAITVSELDPAGVAAWDAFVATCPTATFYHRAGWKEVIEKTFGHRCYFLKAEQGGKIIGVLPLVYAKSLIFGKSLVSTGFTVGGGPAVTDPAALAALDARAIEIAETNDVAAIEYRGKRLRIPIGRKKPAFMSVSGVKSTRMPRKTCWQSPENSVRWCVKG